MQSPWTRDGKIRAEQVSITPQVSGRIVELNIKDNQLVNAGDLLLTVPGTKIQDDAIMLLIYQGRRIVRKVMKLAGLDKLAKFQ